MSSISRSNTPGKPETPLLGPADEALSDHPHYHPNATLLLVGFFGAGKKTLGIIASVALRRRFIDFDLYFKQEVQSSPQEFIARNGLAQYREIELKISRELLTKYDKYCVIVGLGGFASRPQQVLLAEFAQQHPVVYVRRDEQDLRQFVTTSPEKFDRIFELGNEFFESCSNFDFFNLTQGQPDQALPTYLKLKETERLVVAFLRRIFGNSIPQIFSAEPFSAAHTFSLQVPLSWLEETRPDLNFLECGADAIALVLSPQDVQSTRLPDRLSRHIATLRKHSRVAIIIDISSIPSKSLDLMAQEKMLKMTLRLAPDALIISINCHEGLVKSLSSSRGFTKIIADFHELSPVGSKQNRLTPLILHEQTRSLRLGAIRITGESKLPEDNLECISFLKEATAVMDVPVIAYNKELPGRTSICLNPILSPVVLPSTPSSGLTVQQAQKAMTSFFLLPKKKFTIFGQTVKYSLSPEMHQAAYEHCGLPHTYDTLQANEISAVHGLLNDEERGGVTISLPFKSAILPYIDEITEDADDMQAVNTVVIEPKQNSDGSHITVRKGYNTDHIGIRDCIDKHLSPANAVRDGTTALIVGAGGMARAAIYACYELGVQRIFIYNRTPENAQKLADYWNGWAQSKPGVNLQVGIIRSEEPWPSDLRLPTIVVPCIPPFQIGSEHPVVFKIPEHWLESRTGGVFVEVSFFF
ncbi:hypothetical protein N7466_007580 [Penicillium verhagenii]|uniref:uncharacterized protein n=1 Tax=Penicillium verhagenii TaxID=1562060 RepID=UPI0025450D4B|nr:uncharacterized protein N7466_007580 [Penicillium verhagenii]KAJ5928624.1 hypothetical protein N7466_007580 [Penicillium verhagenii]